MNELNGDAATALTCSTFDSVHGRWSEEVEGDGRRDRGSTGPTRSATAASPEPGDVPWGEPGWSWCSSAPAASARARALAPYFDAGVRKVVVAAPVKEGALNVVVGVNDDLYDPGHARRAHRGLVHHQLPGARSSR